MNESLQHGVHMTGPSNEVTVCSYVTALAMPLIQQCPFCRSLCKRPDLSCIQLCAWCERGPCWARVQHNGLSGRAKSSADAIWGLC